MSPKFCKMFLKFYAELPYESLCTVIVVFKVRHPVYAFLYRSEIKLLLRYIDMQLIAEGTYFRNMWMELLHLDPKLGDKEKRILWLRTLFGM